MKTCRSFAQKELIGTPFYHHSQRFTETRFLAIDCEMSGLNPSQDHLLSIGWVAIERGVIQGGSASHIIMRSTDDVGESVLIHGIHDSMVEGGASVEDALERLFIALKGVVAVFHHAPIDLRFLNRECEIRFGAPLLCPYIDTMEIEKAHMCNRGKYDSLKLQDSRERYGLPPYSQHNALSDAQATAELFLAQASYKTHLSSLKLKDFNVYV